MASRYAIETVFRLIDSITAPLDKVGVKSKKVSAKLKNDFYSAQRSVDNFGKSAEKAFKRVAVAAAGVSLAYIVKGTKDALEFEYGLAKINTIARETQEALNFSGQDLLKTSLETGLGVSGLEEATYQAMSAGINELEKATEITAIAAKGAIGGFTDTETIINGVTSTINSFGKSYDSFEDTVNKMLISQNLGKTTAGEIANSIGNVAPTAYAAGMTENELLASITSLTKMGIATDRAVTSVNSGLSNIMKKSSEATKLAKELNIDFSTAAIEKMGWGGFLKDIAKKVGLDMTEFNKAIKGAEGDPDKIEKIINDMAISQSKGLEKFSVFFSDRKAVLGMLALTSDIGMETFNQAMTAYDTQSGVYLDAFNGMMDTRSAKMTKALNAMKISGINIGLDLFPVVDTLSEKITGLSERLNGVDFKPIADKIGAGIDKAEKFIKVLWYFRVPILAIIGVVKAYQAIMILAAIATKGYSLATGIASAASGILTAGVGFLNAAFSASPIGAIIGIFIAFVAIVNVVNEIRENWDSITKAFKDEGIAAGLKMLGSTIMSGLYAPIQGVLELLSKIPGIGKVFSKPLEYIKNYRDTLKGIENVDIAPIPDASAPEVAPQELEKLTEPVTVDLSLGTNVIDAGDKFTQRLPQVISQDMVDISAFDAGTRLMQTNQQPQSIIIPDIVNTNIINAGDLFSQQSQPVEKIDFSKSASLNSDSGRGQLTQSVQQVLLPKAAGMSETERIFISGNDQAISPSILPAQTGNPVQRSEERPGSYLVDLRVPPTKPAVAPVTQGERMAYSRRESHDYQHVDIAVRPEKGTEARVSGGTKRANLRLLRSGDFDRKE